jgi:hypothetical protein
MWKRQLRDLRRERSSVLRGGDLRVWALLPERDVLLLAELHGEELRSGRRLRRQMLRWIVPEWTGMREQRMRLRRDVVHRVLLGGGMRASPHDVRVWNGGTGLCRVLEVPGVRERFLPL